MDKFDIRGKGKLNETGDSGNNFESPQVKSVTMHVPPRDIGENSIEVDPSKSKSKNGFVSSMCDPPLPLCVICN